MKISIPKPCHEDWAEMLPERQGRFCLKCTKTVIDFSQKSKEEIKSFFKEKTGKVCGRFSTDQLEKPKPLFSLAYPAQRIGKFALAIYLVFGTLLFSCSNTKPEPEHLKGDVIEVQQPPAVGQLTIRDTTARPEKVKKRKKTSCSVPTQTLIGDTLIEQPLIEKTLGEVMIE